MTPAPIRDSAGGRAYNDLRNLAHRDARDPAEYFTLYALEGFLRRLAASQHAGDFVLKGGVLLTAYAVRRPTRDIDLAATGISNDIPEVEQRIRAVIAHRIDDGLAFDPTSVSSEAIRDDADYSGVRVKLTARLATAQMALHVDVNFGDPIWPAPTETELPLLLGGRLRLRGYPDHMILAEKIVTAIDRGDQNTRWRDFVDIVAIAATRPHRFEELRSAINVVASHRQVILHPLAPLAARMPELADRKWAIWRRRQRLERSTPEHFGDLLADCIAFADPVLAETGGGTWDPVTHCWHNDLA
ncbi:MAG: nucleotidyl transferase AbiEii/AbiGii toxin family protein [Propionibacteriaceae bacterium]